MYDIIHQCLNALIVHLCVDGFITAKCSCLDVRHFCFVHAVHHEIHKLTSDSCCDRQADCSSFCDALSQCYIATDADSVLMFAIS